jgi:hypothetical protein
MEKIIKDLSTLIIEAMNWDSKEPIILFSSQREIIYNPFKDRLFKNERSRVDKLSRKMHSFVTRKEKKCKKKIYLGVKGKTKHSISDNSNNDHVFTFSPGIEKDDNDLEKLDNEQELIRNKRNKEDDDDKKKENM